MDKMMCGHAKMFRNIVIISAWSDSTTITISNQFSFVDFGMIFELLDTQVHVRGQLFSFTARVSTFGSPCLSHTQCGGWFVQFRYFNEMAQTSHHTRLGYFSSFLIAKTILYNRHNSFIFHSCLIQLLALVIHTELCLVFLANIKERSLQTFQFVYLIWQKTVFC